MLRVLLDTNTVISGFLWRGSPRTILHAVRAGQITAVTSTALLDELSRVLTYDKLRRPLEKAGLTSAELLTVYTNMTRRVEAVPVTAPDLTDPKDLPVLEAAVGGQVAAIISGDQHVLRLHPFAGIAIIPADTAVARYLITP